MREKGKGEKWKRQTDMTTASSSFEIAHFPFPPFPIFPLLTLHFRWLNSYADFNYFFPGFRGWSISAGSMTGAGPLMPPSLRTRQKWTIMNTAAITGMAMQCQM